MLPDARLDSLARLIEIIHRLRAPGGCPWDRAQTHQSLRPYLIEEAYEALDTLDRVENPASLQDPAVRDPLKEELGDVLMQVLLHAEMASETGAFDIGGVAQGLHDKLVRRHPHVFADAVATTEETAFAAWEKQKAKEKATTPDASVLDGVPRGLPALQRAARVVEKVTKVGFQWPDLAGPLGKVDEELAELRDAIAGGDPARIEAELGDLLFCVANVGHLTKANPETALRGTLARFERRFRFVERRLRERGKTPEQSTLEEMDGFWTEAKRSGL